MVRQNRSQSLVINGESGAGKTETTKKAMQFLAALAGSQSRDHETPVEKQVLEVREPDFEGERVVGWVGLGVGGGGGKWNMHVEYEGGRSAALGFEAGFGVGCRGLLLMVSRYRLCHLQSIRSGGHAPAKRVIKSLLLSQQLCSLTCAVAVGPCA
jgi:hypothetical protein